MLSVLVTDKSKISTDSYQIPANITYNDLRIERIILSNTWDNVVNNVWIVTQNGVDKTITISDGRYTESEYASYLQTYLMANTSNIVWIVSFDLNVSKFNIRANNSSTFSAQVKPNNEAQNVFGFPANTNFPASNQVAYNGTEKSDFSPSYLTARSSNLNCNSFAYKTQTSDIIGYIPLDLKSLNSVWQETTSFISDSISKKTVNNQIDLRFYVADKNKIVDPVFSLEISFL